MNIWHKGSEIGEVFKCELIESIEVSIEVSNFIMLMLLLNDADKIDEIY